MNNDIAAFVIGSLLTLAATACVLLGLAHDAPALCFAPLVAGAVALPALA